MHDLDWNTAAPLWSRAVGDGEAAPARFKQPALLRFAGDAFMDELQGVLATDPGGLAGYVARAETWEKPAAGWLDADADAIEPLKLFQPAHGRFYLLAADLSCRRAGLPSRRVDPSRERVSYVVRRLARRRGAAAIDPGDPATYDEQAWLGDRQQGRWTALDDRRTVAAGEERLPLFFLDYDAGDATRRLWAGLVPVGGRETYEEGARTSVDRAATGDLAGDALADPRYAAFSATVVGPLRQLLELEDADLAAEARRSLVYILLELAEFLDAELDQTWRAVADGDDGGLSGDAYELYRHLATASVTAALTWRELLARFADAGLQDELNREEPDDGTTADLVGLTSLTALQAAVAELLGDGASADGEFADRVAAALGDPREAEFTAGVAADLQSLAALDDTVAAPDARADLLIWLLDLLDFLARELPDTWRAVATDEAPDLTAAEEELVSLLADHRLGASTWRELLARAEADRLGIYTSAIKAEIAVLGEEFGRAEVAAGAAGLAADLAAAVADALAAVPAATDVGDGNGDADEATDDTLYLARCVYERPHCGPRVAPVVSQPSRTFRLASFFDPDAPTRPLRIRLPESGLESLRRFPKGVSFLLSRKLRQQMDRAQRAGMQGLIDQDVGEESSFDLGMICSFSIPIITICALILLMIIVSLLNIVFWWLPLFRICLPLPRSSS